MSNELVPETPPASRSTVATLILIGCTLLVFGRLGAANFTWWDDAETIHHNVFLNPPSWEGMKVFWTQPGYGLYIPVTYSVWAAIATISHVAPDPDGIALNPAMFHAANIFWHLLSVLVVYRILRVLNADNFAAMCGALLFGLHPIQAEAVSWISGMKDVLSGTLALTALWQYARFARSDLEQERPATLRYALATTAFVLAMLAKPAAMTMPLTAMVIDRWGVGRPWRRVLPPVAGWLLLAIPIAYLAAIFQPAIGVPDTAVLYRPLIVADSLAFYLFKLVWPVKLCVDYGRTPAVVLAHGWCYWDWIFPTAITTLLIAGKRTRPVLLAAGLIFITSCMPVLGFKKFLFQYFSTTADHYLYVSMFGPALALAWALSIYPSRVARTIAVAVIIGFGCLSFRQCGFWHDDITLFSHNAQVQPNSFLAFNNLGSVYERQGDLETAKMAFQNAVIARDDYILAQSNLAEMLMETGHNDDALRETRKAIELQTAYPAELRPTWSIDYARMGQLLLKSGKPAEAVKALEESLRVDPNQSNATGILLAARAAATQPTTRMESH